MANFPMYQNQGKVNKDPSFFREIAIVMPFFFFLSFGSRNLIFFDDVHLFIVLLLMKIEMYFQNSQN
jgi:hypothetical protein